MRFPRFVPFFVCITLNTFSLFAQSPNGNINGLVSDSSSAAVVGAEIVAVNDVTGVQYPTKTNNEGIYVLPNLPPGPYRLQVSKLGFKTVIKPDIVLNVQDALSINFTMPVGAAYEVLTVVGGAPLVNTESATVSTVVDRQFAENLPMNGRSFQTLIQLTPGVVVVPSTAFDPGQFSVNGQRASSNYWMVDGVSANIGIGATNIGSVGSAMGGTVGSFSAQGGTNSLASVDALQEFRIQTSTYAPEFGRTPGAQISIVTRSGTNQFHGTAFDYFRNDVLDANDWFADRARLSKPEERQNDFGGTFSGPIIKSHTFFFCSYEGLRLRLPQVGQTAVPDVAARQNAVSAMQALLNAYPLPNGTDDPTTGIAAFNASYSNKSTLNATSLRIDHRWGDKVVLFGRYNYSPSENVLRGSGVSLNTVSPTRITTQTATVGTTWSASSTIVNDLRFNYSRVNAVSFYELDDFGGATPLTSLPIPSPYNSQNALFVVGISKLADGGFLQGTNGKHSQPQINLVDNVSLQRGSHGLKFGVDFRRLTSRTDPRLYVQQPEFRTVLAAESGDLYFSDVTSGIGGTLSFRNLGLFAQDTWRVVPRFMLTYGVRWDVDFSPSTIDGPNLQAVTGFDLNDLSNLAVASPGAPAFSTRYDNFAPRVGLAYEISQKPDWQTVLRGGFGIFYDLATSEVGNIYQNGVASYPFGAERFTCCFISTYPLDSATAAPPPITLSSLSSGVLFALDPNLKLPYTLQWNVAVQQALGGMQTLSGSYIGSTGSRLIQTGRVNTPNPSIGAAQVVTNAATSEYHALQLQFQRRMWHGLQALGSYTWSHSIDTASAGSLFGNEANALVPGLNANQNRGSSDFDIRHAFTTGLTYDIPAVKSKTFTNVVLRDWSVQGIVQARSAPPVNVYNSVFFQGLNGALVNIRPDVVPGISPYLHGPQFPGNTAINPSAFANPPVDSSGNPLRQGDLGRNALRGFGATQLDLAVHRDFPIHEAIKLQFRAEMFNLLNHPNFGSPVTDLSNSTQFGQATQMLGRSLDQNAGGGSFGGLYQIGGPRSIQVALKLMF